jgi:hypothetical protein
MASPDRAIKPWIDLWDYLDENFWTACRWAERLPPAELGWQPISQVASIGWNLQHLGEMLDHYLSEVFGVHSPFQPRPPATMISGSQDDGRFHDMARIIAYHRQVRPAYRAFLAGLTLVDLERPLSSKGNRAVSYAWAIGHIAEHESFHLGKCRLLGSLLQGRNRQSHSSP